MAIFAAILVVCLLALVVHYWRQFSQVENDYTQEWLLRWAARGAATPIIVWIVMNTGTMPFMPPLTTHIAAVRAAGRGMGLTSTPSTRRRFAIIYVW